MQAPKGRPSWHSTWRARVCVLSPLRGFEPLFALPVHGLAPPATDCPPPGGLKRHSGQSLKRLSEVTNRLYWANWVAGASEACPSRVGRRNRGVARSAHHPYRASRSREGEFPDSL